MNKESKQDLLHQLVYRMSHLDHKTLQSYKDINYVQFILLWQPAPHTM